jgi:glycosyltransferase involved in cell wall biosynthesis
MVTMAKIGIFTTQLPQLTTAGGIGNVTVRLASQLTLAGHEIEIITARTERPLTRPLRESYAMKGISIKSLSVSPEEVSPWWLSFQYEVEREMSDGDFDLVLSQEWQGPLGLFASLTSNHPPTISWLHGGGLYDRVGSGKDFANNFEIMDVALEEIQISNSQLVVSPSKFLLNFYREFSWRVPKSLIIPYHFPDFKSVIVRESGDEIVLAFVSALSRRKGFDRALALVDSLSKQDFKFTFGIYGKFLDIPERAIMDRLESLGVKYYFRQDLSPSEIWNELGSFNTTLLAPSRLDNSPGVIYEALAASCKVLVSESQGGLELASTFPQHMMLWDIERSDLIRDFVTKNAPIIENIGDINDEISAKWESVISELTGNHGTETQGIRQNVNSGSSSPGISVVIITKDRPKFFKRALESVLSQSMLPNEIVVVEDCSNGKTEVEDMCIHLSSQIRIKYFSVHYPTRDESLISQKVSLGQERAAISRNKGTEKSKFEIVAFLDDDNLFFPNHLKSCYETLVRDEASAVAPFLAQVFSNEPLDLSITPQQIAIMAGDHFGAMNLLSNVAMDSHVMVWKNELLEVGGFPTNSSPEDWALALRLIGNKKSVKTTGIPSILYRLNHDGIQAQITSQSSSWYSMDRESSLFFDTHGSGWFLHRLARQAFINAPTSLSSPTNSAQVIPKAYLRYGISLLKQRKFSLLYYGMRKFISRSRFLK